MNPPQRFALKINAIRRHLSRVSAQLPASAEALSPMSDASDAVILHLWQAVQGCIDVAVMLCADQNWSTPSNYGQAFRELGARQVLPTELVSQLERAVGFRNAIAHAYEHLDMHRVWQAASKGTSDLEAFLKHVSDYLAHACDP